MALTTFPERGTRLDEIWPGLRTIGFEATCDDYLSDDPTEVLIVRILYGGQDYQRVLHLMRDGDALLPGRRCGLAIAWRQAAAMATPAGTDADDDEALCRPKVMRSGNMIPD